MGSPNQEPSLGYNQENSGCHPYFFDWDFDGYTGNEDRAVYLEQCIAEHAHDNVRTKIGILWECYELRPWHYEDAVALKDNFAAIFTYDLRFASLGSPFVYYPMGGSYIQDWGGFSKTKTVSMIVGRKNLTSGHKLRHRIATRIHEGIDYFALPSDPPITNKVPALRPYMYSIVVESSRTNYWFSEKLIDCLSQSTVPVYRGSDLNEHFNEMGIVKFSDEKELEYILPHLTQKFYASLVPHIYENLRLAQKYKCVEDWLFKNYPQFFGETV